MADPESYTLEGADRVAETLRRAAGQLGDLESVNRRTAAIIADRARSLAPVLTGALRASIVGAATRTDATVGSPLVYAPVIHNGWPAHHISAHPYVREAATQTAKQWQELYQHAVDQAAGQVRGA